MENSQTPIVINFESVYRLYYDSYHKLVSCHWREKQSYYDRFQEYITLAIENYFELIEKSKFDYFSIIKLEFNDLIAERYTLEMSFSEDFIDLYKVDETRYFFIMCLILKKNPREDLTEDLIAISDYVFEKQDWQNKIIYIVEVLGLYENPKGLCIIEKLLVRLEKTGEVYDEEIGNHILVYLSELPANYLLPFLQKYDDYPLEEINKHLTFLRKKKSGKKA